MGRLTFKAADVRRVVEHALQSPAHDPERVSYEPDVTKPGKPAVLLVHDQGVYLMSNGNPRDMVDARAPNGTPQQRSFVAYAMGCNPETDDFNSWWEQSRALVGGDDFVETLPWALQIVDQLIAGATLIHIDVRGDALELVEYQAVHATNAEAPTVIRQAEPPRAPGSMTMTKQVFLLEITAAHVNDMGKLGEHRRLVFEAIGRLMPVDVGKRVYRVGDVIQVENNEQRDARRA